MHWADVVARRVVESRQKDEYSVESGITPSGYVHIGNFRELFTAYIVGKAIKDLGHRVKQYHVWDDYDRFRKVPSGVPKEWEQYLTMPVAEVPDPWGCHESYAEHFIDKFEQEIEQIGIEVVFIRASEMYKSGKYAELVRLALVKRDKIIEILNRFKKIAKQEQLDESWYPIQLYCPKCRKETKVLGWDGDWSVEYECPHCQERSKDDIRNGNVKLRWRIDWPMRWSYFGIDFEPAGKDHLAAGSSYDTGVPIAREVYGYEPPETLMYEFVGLKGEKGKMSGSKGNVILLSDLLRVMEPALIRYIYAVHKPQREMKIDLGIDLLKKYDDFDKVERAYFGQGSIDIGISEEDAKRTYELSVPNMPERLIAQAPFKFLVVLVQIYDDNEKIVEILKKHGHVPNELDDKDLERIGLRIALAKNWVQDYAPEFLKFEIKSELPKIEISEPMKELLYEISENLDNLAEIGKRIIELAKSKGLDHRKVFRTIYRLFLGKDQGPRINTLFESLDQDFIKARLRLEK